VQRWADRVIEHEPDPPPEMIEVASAAPTDLSGLRHALSPLAIEPEPSSVIEALLGVLYADLTSGHRRLADTLTVLRQMRSMLRLPPRLYADLNAALVAHAAEGETCVALATWLQHFDRRGVDTRAGIKEGSRRVE
jgi:hypothetical protein